MKNLKIVIVALSLASIGACKKTDSDWRQSSVDLSDPEIEQTEERAAIVHYSMKVSGNPRPEILEFGLIVTANPEAPFHGVRFPSTQADDLVDYSFNLNDLEGGTWFYVRPYAVTHRDTILGEIASFFSGKYYTEGDGVYDIEGNFYETVIINGQEWMAENLRSRTFCNGDTLALIHSLEELSEYPWLALVTFSNRFDSSYDILFGRLYPSELIVEERNICPCGWRIPRRSDILALMEYAGGDNDYVGGKFKSAGTLELGTGLWSHPNLYATNLLGLNIHPAGEFWRGPNIFYADPLFQDGKIFIYNDVTTNSNIKGCIAFRSYLGRVTFLGAGPEHFMGIRCVKE